MTVVAAELAGVAALFVVLLLELLTQRATSLGTALALVVVLGLAAVALAAILAGIWRGTAWVRAAGTVVQVLFAAIGVGALQGAFADPNWGWPLVIVGVLGFGLLVSKPVAAWLNRRDAAS